MVCLLFWDDILFALQNYLQKGLYLLKKSDRISTLNIRKRKGVENEGS